jgi:hypothetical protein
MTKDRDAALKLNPSKLLLCNKTCRSAQFCMKKLKKMVCVINNEDTICKERSKAEKLDFQVHISIQVIPV